MSNRVAFIPNDNLQNELALKSANAINAGIHKFHRIEIDAELIPAMHGDLMGEGIKQYEYGDNFGYDQDVGTLIELTNEKKGTIEEVHPAISRLFYGIDSIHTTNHPDINKGGEHSYKNVYGDSGLIYHKNAKPRWTEEVMNGAQFREEIMQEMANAFKNT